MSPKRRKLWDRGPRLKAPKSIAKTDSNRFQVLSDMEDDNSSIEENENVEESVKVPPIIVDIVHSFTEIIKLLGSTCKYKRMSIGTKVMPNTLPDYNETIKNFKSNDIKFFTHPVKDGKSFKLMLFGLPQLDIKTIVEEFQNAFNIIPTKVIEVKTNRSNPDDALYMLEFDKSQVSKREVIKIRYFYGIVVHWRNPRRNAKGPTQCTKCTMFGHGSSNCFRKSACLGCGGPHDYSTCQLNKTNHDGPVIYKCFNCMKNKLKNINHRADDVNCPSRHEYLEIRQRVTRNQKSFRGNQNTDQDPFIWDEDFPQLHNSTDELPSCSKAQINYSKHFNPSKTNINQSRDKDDLSNDKLLEIFFSAIDALEKCKTKFDKMRVLGMMLKHVI